MIPSPVLRTRSTTAGGGDKMNKFEKMYNPCGLRIPKRLAKPMALKFGKYLTHPKEWF